MSRRDDFIQGEAELGSEEDDESFDGEEDEDDDQPRRRERPSRIEDSSEEEDDDDDEEEAAKIREGFIVDESEEEDGDGDEDSGRERKRRKKRRRAEREEEAQLDEEDLDLIGESRPDWDRQTEKQQKFKRLKRGHRDEAGQRNERPDLAKIFSDEEDEGGDEIDRYARPAHHGRQLDEMDDFIEEDFPEDEDERLQRQEDLEVARPRERFIGGVIDTTGLDKDALDDMDKIFGDGGDYAWVFDIEDEEEDREVGGEQGIELKDVFEPSQLQEKLMTDSDNLIRYTDEPERFQIDRKPFRNLQITPEQFKEEARWVFDQMWATKRLSGDLRGPFSKAVGKVLEFFVVDDVEVPYVFQHRKDYLIHAKPSRSRDDRDGGGGGGDAIAEKLLNQDDLWRILELDIRFRSFVEKRNSLEKMYDNLRSSANVEDSVFEDLVVVATTMEDLQDLQDHLNFQYATQLRELADNASKDGERNGNGVMTKRPGAKSTSVFERTRKSKANGFTKAYGINADRLAQNALRHSKKTSPDDVSKLPVDLADSLTDDVYSTGDAVISAARNLYAEELFISPRLRKYFRSAYLSNGLISCRRTEKGMRRIDEAHPFYEIKYMINQTLQDLGRRPEIFLKMVKAEEEGLVEIKLVLQNEREFRRQLYTEFASDNFSELADAWNDERQKVLDLAFPKIEKAVTKGVKDSLRTACQDEILKACRDEYSKRLDQAPFKPKGLVLGTPPRVLTLSNGMEDPARGTISWTWVEEDGRVLEHGRFGNLARDDKEREAFAEVVQRRRPDVVGVSGFSADTHKLVKDLESLINEKGLMGPEYDDPDTNDYRSDLLEVVVVNDEVARLYKDSPRAVAEHPSLNPMLRYCVALARYLQNPMKEYAALGKDVQSLIFHSCQNLLPAERLARSLESAMVDMVNLCGVDINEAVSDSYTANLLPYISGLGPRKATAVIKGINANGGSVTSRDELVGDPDSGKLAVVGPRVWNNCASFLFIEYDSSNPASDPLDNTRVHPEDYELGRKMAADALELDEEDVKAETDENGPGAIVRKLFKEEEQEKVNELILEEYAEQLVTNYNQRKRATLETIRAELQAPYEELRRKFVLLNPDVVFTMFTGETKDSLCEGMIIPVFVRVVKDDFAIVKLDCGIEGRIESHEGPSSRGGLRDSLRVGQTAQAKLLELNRKDFISKLSVREDALRRPFRKFVDHERGTWDFRQEDQDREDLTEKDKTTGRTQRVIKHPLFRPFNATQAEEYLGSQAVGDMVIRPSSRGNDHLVVTWKVADGVYEHIDVLELQKENEFSVGRLLRIGGKYSYTDLDELIVEHVKAMAKKVGEMTRNEKFQQGTRADTEKWLTTYMDANPNRSSYAFCADSKHPGYFFLCFKVNRNTRVNFWPVRVIPKGFEMLKVAYPDMRALTNGFKMRYQNEILKMQNGGRESSTASGNGRAVKQVPIVDGYGLSLESFRELAFTPAKPLLVKASSNINGATQERQLPATQRWFDGEAGPSLRLAQYLDQFAMAQLPYELMYPPQPGGGQALASFHKWLSTGDSTSSDTPKAIRSSLAELLAHYVSPLPANDDEKSQLIRMEAPLALFLAAVEYNASLRTSSKKVDAQLVTQLYIAQASLSELPPGLRDDVPAPDLVQRAGRGDVYDASLWLGLEPTYTPWHRDPNPNLFCQLASSKIVRLMAPVGGERIFREVQTELMKMRNGQSAHASSRIRGEEMMQGPERELLHQAVWGEDGGKSVGTMHEAKLDAGDMLFIPKGWWHSVKSAHSDGRLNGSVNWWFR